MIVSVGQFNIIVFRGTSTPAEWNIISEITQIEGIFTGFKHIYDTIKSSIQTEPNKRLIVTGHSLGASIAVLYALDNNVDVVYTFGGPRIGNTELAHRIDSTITLWRIVNPHDIVCDIPLSVTPNMFNTKQPLIFQHAGITVYTINTSNLGTLSLNHEMLVYSNKHLPRCTSICNHRYKPVQKLIKVGRRRI